MEGIPPKRGAYAGRNYCSDESYSTKIEQEESTLEAQFTEGVKSTHQELKQQQMGGGTEGRGGRER